MPSYGRSSSVRSHRRGGPRRRIRWGPWLLAGTVLAVVAAGVSIGYPGVLKAGCSGQIEANVVVTPRVESIMYQLSQDWAQTSPSIRGTCAAVTVVARDSAEVAIALTGDWDTKTLGRPPDVWVPDSSAWVRKASADSDAERIMPDLQPSLARTPTVIAMPKPLAAAAGMTGKELTWLDIITKLNSPDGWKTYSHEEWGSFRLGLSDPQVSTAGLLALMAISDTDDSGDISEQEQATLLALRKVIKVKTRTTGEIFDALRSEADKDATKALSYVSAFPALEQDVLDYNLDSPKVPLVAIYPQDGTAEADFPYLVLNANWSTGQHKDVATAFLRYVRGSVGRDAFKAAGMRDPNRAPGPELIAANGLIEKITALPRAVLLPESVEHAAASWTAVTRPTNLLLVFDTSGSMGLGVQGTGKTRLDLTKAAALNSLSLLDETARVGVWSYSSAAEIGSGKSDHEELVPLAPLGAAETNGTHAEVVNETISGLTARGHTGLYNTAWAACQAVQAAYVPGAANLIVLLTDGDDNNVTGGLTLEKLLSNLKDNCGDSAKPVRLITIGLGTDLDQSSLREISRATNATSFTSPRSFDINQVFLEALFS